MIQRNIALTLGSFGFALCMALAPLSAARAEDDALLKLKNHTEVKLAFDNEVNSKTAKPGDVVHLHVSEPVTVEDKTVIAAGKALDDDQIQSMNWLVQGVQGSLPR